MQMVFLTIGGPIKVKSRILILEYVKLMITLANSINYFVTYQLNFRIKKQFVLHLDQFLFNAINNERVRSVIFSSFSFFAW